MSFGDLVLGPIYTALGRDAVLTVSAVDYAITAIDRTQGLAAGSDLEMQTVGPVAAVRAADLATLGLIAGDLDDAALALNGKDWRVTSARPLPSPEGEADGEYLLLLEQATDPDPI